MASEQETWKDARQIEVPPLLADEQNTLLLDAPASAGSSPAASSSAVVLGENLDTHKDILISDKERTSGMHVIGGTGTGKSTLLTTIFLGDIKNGHGGLFIDVDGDSILDLLPCIPSRRMKDVIFLDPGFDNRYFGINPLSGVKSSRDADRVIQIFKRLWKIGPETPNLENTLRACLLTLWYNQKTIAEMPYLLRDEAFRKACIAHLPSSVSAEWVRWYWEQDFGTWYKHIQLERSDSTLNKILQLLMIEQTAYVVSQNKTTLDFRKLMDENKIILLRLSLKDIGEDAVRFLGTMLMAELKNALLSRADSDNRPFFSLCADEWQLYLTPDFKDMLTRGRKYGLKPTIANQTLSQLREVDKELEGITQQVKIHVTFRVGADDADTLAPYYAKDPPPGEEEIKPIYEPLLKKSSHTVTKWEPPEKEQEYKEILAEKRRLALSTFVFCDVYLDKRGTFEGEYKGSEEKNIVQGHTTGILQQLFPPRFDEVDEEPLGLPSGDTGGSLISSTFGDSVTRATVVKKREARLMRTLYEDFNPDFSDERVRSLQSGLPVPTGKGVSSEVKFPYSIRIPGDIPSPAQKRLEWLRDGNITGYVLPKDMSNEDHSLLKEYAAYLLNVIPKRQTLPYQFTAHREKDLCDDLDLDLDFDSDKNSGVFVISVTILSLVVWVISFLIFRPIFLNYLPIGWDFLYLETIRLTVVVLVASYMITGLISRLLLPYLLIFIGWLFRCLLFVILFGISRRKLKFEEDRNGIIQGEWEHRAFPHLLPWVKRQLMSLKYQAEQLTKREQEVLLYRKTETEEVVEPVPYVASDGTVYPQPLIPAYKYDPKYSYSHDIGLRPGYPIRESVSTERTGLFEGKPGKPTRTYYDMEKEAAKKLLNLPDHWAHVAIGSRGDRNKPRMKTKQLPYLKEDIEEQLLRQHRTRALENAALYTREATLIETEIQDRRKRTPAPPVPVEKQDVPVPPLPTRIAKRRVFAASADGVLPSLPFGDDYLMLLYHFHYLTLKQIVRLLQRESSENNERTKINSLVDKGLIEREPVSRATSAGRVPYVYSLSQKGSKQIEAAFGVSAGTRKGTFNDHTLLVNDALIAAVLASKLEPALRLCDMQHERYFKQNGIPLRNTRTLEPDGFLHFQVSPPFGADNESIGIALEIDLGSESKAQIFEKLNKYIAFASGIYQERFGLESLTIAFCVPGGDARPLVKWTEQALQEKKEYAELFVFTGSDPATTHPLEWVSAPLWYQPFDTSPHSLIEKQS